MIDNDMHAPVQFKAEPVTSIIGAIDHTILNRNTTAVGQFKNLHYYDEPYNFLTKMKIILDTIIKKIFHRFSTTHHTHKTVASL